MEIFCVTLFIFVLNFAISNENNIILFRYLFLSTVFEVLSKSNYILIVNDIIIIMNIKLLIFVIFVMVAKISSVLGIPFHHRRGQIGGVKGQIQIPTLPPFNPHARPFPRN